MKFLKNFLGCLKGYGGCLKCGDTWDWKKEQNIPYTNSSKMFPLCNECFSITSEGDILFWCRVLFKKWENNPSEIERYIPRLKREIKLLKKGIGE